MKTALTSPDFVRYLNVRSATGASFSPDGRRITFLTDITGVAEVWSVALTLETSEALRHPPGPTVDLRRRTHRSARPSRHSPTGSSSAATSAATSARSSS